MERKEPLEEGAGPSSKIEPHEAAEDVNKPSTTGAERSENEAQKPEADTSECGSSKPTGTHPRHSILRLFDPLYPESPANFQSSEHPQLVIEDSEESGNPQSLPSEVSDDEASFLDACNTATDEASSGTPVPKEKILESDESFMKFNTPVKVNAAPPSEETEEESVLQSSPQSTSNDENITESEIVSVISKRLTVRPNIRIRSKFTLTEAEQKNYVLTDVPLQSDIRSNEPEPEQAENIAGQAVEQEEPFDDIQIDPNPEVEIRPAPEIEDPPINEENVGSVENIEVAEINTEQISCESREVESSLSTEVIPEKKTDESEERLSLTQKISSVNPEVAVGTKLIFIHQDDDEHHLDCETEQHQDSGVDSIESIKSPKSHKSDFEDSERGEEEDLDPEREDSSLPYEKLNQTTVQPKQESESQVTSKEESKTDAEGGETGEKRISSEGNESYLSDIKLTQTTSETEGKQDISPEEDTCLPDEKLNQTTRESEQESVDQITSEDKSKADLEDSESEVKQNTSPEGEDRCLPDKKLKQTTGDAKEESTSEITSKEESRTDFEVSETGKEQDIRLKGGDSCLPVQKLSQTTGESKQESPTEITPKEESKTDFEDSETEKKQDIGLKGGSSGLADQTFNQITGEFKQESASRITSEESKTDFEDSEAVEKQDINPEEVNDCLPDQKLNQITGESKQDTVGQITSEEETKTGFEDSERAEKQDTNPVEERSCLQDKQLNEEPGELKQESTAHITSEEESKTDIGNSKLEEEQDNRREDICLPDKKLNQTTDESVDQTTLGEGSKVDNSAQDEASHLLDECSKSRVVETELEAKTSKYDIDTKDSTDGQKSDIESSTLIQPSDTKSTTNLDYFKTKMADLGERLSEQQQENSDLKLQLNAIQQAKASLELEIRQKEEIIIKTQAEALKNEQSFKQEIKQLREELKENSKLIEKDSNKELQDQLKEAKAKEAKAVAELGQKTKDVLNFQKIMEEYEKTIATRFTDYQKLKEDHETATRHLTNIEMAFSDVHQKYERTKVIIEGFKANEETLKTNLQAFEKLCKQHEERYESLKAHAKGQIEKSNKEILALRDKYEMDINKLKAIIKRLEIKCSSLEVSLLQKTEECTALSALCDEVTGKKV